VTESLNTYGSDYGDVDGDGDLDILLVNQGGSNSRLILNQGFLASVSTPPNWATCPTLTGAGLCPISGAGFPATNTPGGHELGAYFGDVDGDGDLDIIWGSFNSGTGPFLFKNNAVP
jgi:hypothetical protein